MSPRLPRRALRSAPGPAIVNPVETRGPPGGRESGNRVNVWLALSLGLVTGLLGLLGNVVASFLATWSGALTWLAVPVAALCVSVITALAQAHVHARFRSSPTSPHPPPGPAAAAGPWRRRGISLTAALLTVLLVIGVGGFVVTWGVQYAVGYVTGNESGEDRLAAPAAASAAGLTLTVSRFEETRHFTRLTVSVHNDVGESLALPLYGNCVLTGGDGTTIEADAFRSDWSDSVAAGARQSGTIVVNGHLPPGVRRASLAFARVYGGGFSGPDSIRIDGIALVARSDATGQTSPRPRPSAAGG